MDRLRDGSGGLIFAVGIEDTFVPQTSPGRRELDLYGLTGHYEGWREDLDLAASTGASAIRYGVPWYRVNPAPERWDWSWTDRVFEYMLSLGLEPVVDLVHYGCPLWLEGEFANPDYPDRVAAYAHRLASRYGDRVRHYTPLNEPLVNIAYCGEEGRWPPGLTGDEGFTLLTRQVCRGIVQTQSAIEDAVPDPVHVHVEATFRYAGGPEHAGRVSFLRERAWIVYDLLLGRVGPDHPLHGYLGANGFSDDDFLYFRDHTAEPDVVGVNYYPHMTTVEFRKGGEPRRVWSGGGGLEEVLRAFCDRYGKPVFLTETSVVGSAERRVAWLRESLRVVMRLREAGLPVVGYTWWPLFSLVDWDYREGEGPVEEYLRHMGIYDLEPDGRGGLRRVETPVAGEFRGWTGDPNTTLSADGKDP